MKRIFKKKEEKMVVNKKEMEVTLLYIDIEQFKKEIYDDYCVIFPEEERKPLKLIETACLRGYMKIIKIVHDKELVGFMILNKIKENGYAVLDYFAILPQYQGRGFGTISLKDLLEQEKDSAGIFIEIEKIGLGKDETENKLRENRKQFYERLGFHKLDFDLLLFDVVYMPYMFSNLVIHQDIVINEIMEIYEAIAGKERIKKNCKFIKRKEILK